MDVNTNRAGKIPPPQWKAWSVFSATRTGPNRLSYLFRFSVRAAMILLTWPGLTMILETRCVPEGEFNTHSIMNSSALWLTSIMLL